MEPTALEAIAAAVAAELRVGPGAAAALSGTSLPPITEVCTDSRAIVPGCLFVALKGPSFDGHAFVAEAIGKGAAAALVAREWADSALPTSARDRPCLVVADTLVALGDLARWYRSHFTVPVLAVTGSVGKTSTKAMAAAILSRRWPTLSAEASYNNEVGVPLTLLRLERRHGAVVLELAMRGEGQIRYLAEIARPAIGVITNIGSSHLELLGTREAIARAKGELLEALPPDGAAVLPAADPFLPLLRSLSRAPVTTFGMAGSGADLQVSDVVAEPSKTRFVLEGMGIRVAVRLPVPGAHQALNAAAAAGAALHAGATADDIAEGLPELQLPPMRMQVRAGARGLTILDDAYNASPASMAAALDHLRRLPGGRRVAILGDMLELGRESAAEHRRVGEVAATTADLLLTVGERAREIAAGAVAAGMPAEAVMVCDDAASALEKARAVLQPGDAVLVKASRGMKLERVVEGLRDE